MAKMFIVNKIAHSWCDGWSHLCADRHTTSRGGVSTADKNELLATLAKRQDLCVETQGRSWSTVIRVGRQEVSAG
jgi:hypothetical protein